MVEAKLTPKQKQFCEEYLVDLNATQAAIRAGYAENAAAVTAARNLTKPAIAKYISELQQSRSQRTQITADMVVKELAAIGFSRVDDFVVVVESEREIPAEESLTGEAVKVKYKHVDIRPTSEVGADKLPAIAQIEQGQTGIKVKLHDKVKSLELLGRHLGIFKKDNEQTAPPAPTNAPTLDLSHLTFEQLKELKYGKQPGSS